MKIDLHTHSIASLDGGITAEQYRAMLKTGLGCVAVTDHNTIDFAVKLHKALGERVIVGEEIMTQTGEIIGLYLREHIPPALSLAETVQRIKQQGGLVYVPHPFETVRHGVSEEALNTVKQGVDIMEVMNGRTLQNKTEPARAWAERYNIVQAAASDAHGWHGWGRTYTEVAEMPTKETLVSLLQQSGAMTARSPGLRGLLYPKFNRLKKVFHA